jgi:ABC-type sugar transport system substrate-binding protein
MVACGAKEEAAAPEAAPAATEAAKEEAAAPEAEAPADGILSEEDAAAARDAGTLVGDDYAGYNYYEGTDTWYYSNYPNYKDFKADGKVKVAFVCKFSGAWFTPKANSLGETVKEAGYEYLFIDANSDEQAWIDGVQNIINQDFDAVVMTPVNTALLPDAVAMLQEAGIAYMTTDDPGPDAYGFFAPHYGLDDYYLHNELGKYVAQKITEENWLEGVADDWSNFLFVLQDSPAVEAIHLRNVGFYEGIVATHAIPESQVVWLDCGGSLSDEVAAKFSSTVQANAGVIDKWLVSAGGAASITPTMTLFKEAGVDLANVKFADCFSTDEPLKLMMSDPAVAACSYGACLSSAPSGVGMGNILIDLFTNGTPIPGFTGYELIIADGTNFEQRYNEIYGG